MDVSNDIVSAQFVMICRDNQATPHVFIATLSIFLSGTKSGILLISFKSINSSSCHCGAKMKHKVTVISLSTETLKRKDAVTWLFAAALRVHL